MLVNDRYKVNVPEPEQTYTHMPDLNNCSGLWKMSNYCQYADIKARICAGKANLSTLDRFAPSILVEQKSHPCSLIEGDSSI